MRNIEFAVLILMLAFNGAQAGEKLPNDHEPVSLGVVADELAAATGGIVQFNSLFEADRDVTKLRLINKPLTYYTLGEHKRDTTYNQTVFQTDVRKYIESEGAADFLDAKRSFYSRLNFDLKHQRHERPYPYLFDWKSLNHPPIRELKEPLEFYIKEMKYDGPDTSTKYFDAGFQKELDEMSQTELTRGNKLKILANSVAQDEKIRQVVAAKDFIFAAVMAWECDKHSGPLMDAMIKRAQEGVDVRVMVEKFYTDTVYGKCIKKMQQGGIQVANISDKWKYKLAFFHNKFFVFDGNIGIIGGQNIAHYETLSDGFNHYNRDTDLLIEGPATADLLEAYIDLWETHVNREFVNRKKHKTAYPYRALLKELRNKQVVDNQRGQMYYADWLADPSKRMDGLCRIAIQKPYGRNFFLADLFIKYFDAAKHSAVMTTPDMHFDHDGAKKIKSPKATEFHGKAREAARRGVRVDLISNGRDGGYGEFTAQLREWSDQAEDRGRQGLATFWARREESQAVKMIAETRELLKMLAKTPNYYSWNHFQYIHAKQILWDNIVSVVGSVNLDDTALDRNHEGAAICMDESLGQQMRELMTLDLVNSVPVISKNGE